MGLDMKSIMRSFLVSVTSSFNSDQMCQGFEVSRIAVTIDHMGRF